MRYHEVKLPSGWETGKFLPISDVHRGSPQFAEKAWRELLSWVRETDDARVFLNGDLVEAAIRESHGDVSHSMTPEEEMLTLQSELAPIQGKLLGIVPGNHEERVVRKAGTDPARILAKFLDIPYDPEGFVLKISLGKNDGHSDRGQVYHIYCTHGAGGGQTPGAKANRMQRMSLQIEGMDAHVVGHGHQLMGFADQVMTVDPRNMKLIPREKKYVQAGSFQLWQGYAVRYGFTPGCQTMPLLMLDGRKHKISLVM